MIGVDTNILLRLYVADDHRQHEVAATFFGQRSEDSPAFISLIVFVEFIWSLTRTYKYSWESVYSLVAALTAARDIVIEREQVVVDAMALAIENNVGFVDAIVAATHEAQGGGTTMTFDKKAASRIPSMELLS
jgi:predicted nucleic-acid-binding protein